MDIHDLLKTLRYASSRNCLQGKDLDHAPDYGHVFRRAQDTVHLTAVYTLRPPTTNGEAGTQVPIVYVCKASSLDQADEIHRLVWNQNIIPFLIVLAPQGIRVYSGFERHGKKGKNTAQDCILEEKDFAKVAKVLAPLTAESIDSGAVWDHWGSHVRPQQRVEWRLLKDLEILEELLTADGLTDPTLVHSLIGKFVYLYYLRHREILSNDRLKFWKLTWDDVAGKTAKLTSFGRLCDELDERLNGAIFPLTKTDLKTISTAMLQRIADIFAGGTPSGQLHLDFDAYDFSHIPIETLSVIYEQFLHHKKTDTGTTAAEEQAAYYTPIPVVNFIIDRMDEIKPLRPGMRVLDFACGSGAFLVQCYRKLIEDQWRSAPDQRRPRPPELRDLLVKHIFGMDVDAEACRVAELSLQLTLLDYIEPPDLLTTNGHDHPFKLPSLSGTNIVEANAFDDHHDFVVLARIRGFDWLVGNPPWKDIGSATNSKVLKPVLDWMQAHKADKPTGGNQAAEAFSWRAQDFATSGALAGLLIPAMTLFKTESTAFRQRFFASNPPAYVANFANLAEVLFAGRSRVPAAAIIFQAKCEKQRSNIDHRIPVFSPLVANQEPTHPRVAGQRVDSWSIVVNEAEIHELNLNEITTGAGLPWKMAAWGSHLDNRLLRRLSHLNTLGEWANKIGLVISQGLELRGPPPKGNVPQKSSEKVKHYPKLAGRLILETKELKGLDRIFTFPRQALHEIQADEAYVRIRGGYELPEAVSHPPHVFVSAARNWAVFWEEDLIVPPRQIGIAGRPEHAAALKALAAYLNSDFLRYHQFFASTEQGVTRERSTLRSLREIPIPTSLANMDKPIIVSWCNIYDNLTAIEDTNARSAPPDKLNDKRSKLLTSLNEMITNDLNLAPAEHARVRDFVGVVMGLEAGKVEERAIRNPSEPELHAYGISLKRELDSFVGAEARDHHGVQIWHDAKQGLGVIRIGLETRHTTVTVHPRSEGIAVIRQATELRRTLESQSSQWRYFNRNLQLFLKDENRIYLFKPLQRFHWLESQAVLDASEVIGLILDRSQRSR